MTTIGRRKPIAERFWSKVHKTDGCWEWIGCLDSGGYGQINHRPRGPHPYLAHRLSWWLHYGPIAEGMNVCHRCDNTKCVRPEHLFLGTHQDNMIDKGRKARQARGTNIARSKLTTGDVIEIRQLYALGHRSGEIARRFSVCRRNVTSIIAREIWKHVP